MSTIFIILIGLAALHFVYEAIALPSIRQSLRFRLFRSRDRLRRLKIERGNEVSDSAFEYLDEAISNQIAYQHRLSIVYMMRLRYRAKIDPEFDARIKARLAKIEKCSLPEFQAIEREVVQCFMSATLAASGFAVAALVPFAVGASICSILKRSAAKSYSFRQRVKPSAILKAWTSPLRKYAAQPSKDFDLALC